MASEIRIHAPALELVRGASMRVPITLALDRALKVRGVHAQFWGSEETKAVYTTTTVNSKGHVQSQQQTAVEHNDVVKQEHLLFGSEKLGCLAGLGDSLATLFGGGKHSVMQPGEYHYEVEVAIPEDAPASHSGKKSRVFYELSVWADIPLARDIRSTQSFLVQPVPAMTREPQPVRTRYPEDEGRGLFESLISPDVRMEMAVAADQYQLNDPIDGIVTIQCSKPVKCDAVRVRLAAVEKSEARGHKDTVWHYSEPVEIARPGTLDAPFSQEFALTAVAAGPLSARGKRFSVEWYVQVEFDVPWAKDPAVRVPIMLLSPVEGSAS